MIRRSLCAVVAVCCAVAGLITAAPGAAVPAASADRTTAGAPIAWPASGQAAYRIGDGPLERHSTARAVPIASIAKVMTAYVVLHDHPLRPGSNGFTLRVTAHDVADTARRVRQDQSTVPVRAGEVLTERQALAALLLPSANNVAVMLARRDRGSIARFVAQMNRTARQLGMTSTRYTDPSGFAATTRSTATDQTRLVAAAMAVPAFAAIVRRTHARIPVAGRIATTDVLLGRDGVIGVKTGSDDAAGGCFAFAAYRWLEGRRLLVVGVVLGQPGTPQVLAGQRAARSLLRSLPGSPAR